MQGRGKGEGGGGGGQGTVHQADGYFEYVIAKGKVAEAVPGIHGPATDALLGIAQSLLCVVV